MDNLTKDVLAAERAGMTYGKWKAAHPYTRPDPNRNGLKPKATARVGICKICGKEFEYTGPYKAACSDECRAELHRVNNQNSRNRRKERQANV